MKFYRVEGYPFVTIVDLQRRKVQKPRRTEPLTFRINPATGKKEVAVHVESKDSMGRSQNLIEWRQINS